MNAKKLIEQNQVSELSALVFNQHFDNSSTNGYTYPLGAEDEALVVKQMLLTQSSDWYNFVKRYLQHYPLSNQADELLADNAAENPFARKLLVFSIKKYGCHPAVAERLCKYLLTAKADGSELINVICLNSHLQSPEVRVLLERLADREHACCPEKATPQYAAIYDKTISDYHSARF